MIRNLFLLSVLLTLSLSISAQDLYRVKADKLNVRATNDPKGKIIGFIPGNENVMVLDSSDAKYFKVRVKNAEGWVSSEFLEKIASAQSKPIQTQPVIVAPKAEKDYSGIIFFSIVAIAALSILFFTFKYAYGNKILVAIVTIVVLAVGYFCYVTFIKEKAISGVFNSDSDTQYQSFNFKSKNLVEVRDNYADSTFTTNYVIEDDIIKLQQQENTILLMIRDEYTLIGEGFTKGVYQKK
jgi:hypothetical protein